MAQRALTKDRHDLRYGVALLPAGLLRAAGARRVIVHHDSFLLLAVAAIAMPARPPHCGAAA